MTDADIKSFIKLSIPPDRRGPDADAIASAAMNKAILKVGKMSGVEWNRTDVQFTLASGKRDNVQGIDFMTRYPDIINMQLLYHSDETGGQIEIVSEERFKNESTGAVISGRPRIASFNSQGRLSVYPTPDKQYTVTARVKMVIDNLSKIPSNIHDLVIDEAILAVQAALSSGIAVRNAMENRQEATSESPTGYDGNQIKTDESLARVVNDRNPTSWNLTGN